MASQPTMFQLQPKENEMKKTASRKKPATRGLHVIGAVQAYKPKFPPGTVLIGPSFVVDTNGVIWFSDPVAGLLTRAKTKP